MLSSPFERVKLDIETCPRDHEAQASTISVAMARMCDVVLVLRRALGSANGTGGIPYPGIEEFVFLCWHLVSDLPFVPSVTYSTGPRKD